MEEELSQDYVEGFNKGYTLREHKPDRRNLHLFHACPIHS